MPSPQLKPVRVPPSSDACCICVLRAVHLSRASDFRPLMPSVCAVARSVSQVTLSFRLIISLTSSIALISVVRNLDSVCADALYPWMCSLVFRPCLWQNYSTSNDASFYILEYANSLVHASKASRCRTSRVPPYAIA